MGTLWHNVVAVLVAALLQSVAVTGNFQLEVRVVRVSDPVDDCGGGLDVCYLYINEMCLDPQFEEPGPEEEEQECSLIKDENNLHLESGLPKTRTLSVTNQPWPVDFQLCVEVVDYDALSSDDHIEDVVVLESLNTSSEFSEQMDYRNTPGGRITLSMRFRVQCNEGYEGPHCDCLPHNDDISGHYSCREDGGISCLPGYTNTSNLCRQQGKCEKMWVVFSRLSVHAERLAQCMLLYLTSQLEVIPTVLVHRKLSPVCFKYCDVTEMLPKQSVSLKPFVMHRLLRRCGVFLQ
jgi:hypothetical protein